MLVKETHFGLKIETFEAMLKKIESEKSRHVYVVDAKVSRAKFLLERKHTLEKKLADVQAELDGMAQGDAAN